MKKKLRLPILLLAVVVMLSIFYIREANKTKETPVTGPTLTPTTTNAEFAEARLQKLEEVQAMIKECESKIAEGKLSAKEIAEQNALIVSLKETKANEIALEEMIMAALNYDDVLVLLEDGVIAIDVYTEETLTVQTFIKVSRLAKEKFSSNYTVKLSSSSPSS